MVYLSEDVTPTAKTTHNYCLVITPTYNEALNIERLIDEVLAQGPQFDILVVDDNSPDGTGDLVAARAAQSSRVHLIRRAGKLGLGTAYVTGFRYALQRGYSFVLQMDADFSHQPRYLPRLLTYAERGYDLVIGSRNVAGGSTQNWPLRRKLISQGGSLYTRLVLNLPIYDCTGGFKCFRASALQRINLNTLESNGYAFQIEMNYRCYQAGVRIKEMPIIFVERVAGVSKMSPNIVKEAALKVLKLRFSPNPYRVTHLGLLHGPRKQTAKR